VVERWWLRKYRRGRCLRVRPESLSVVDARCGKGQLRSEMLPSFFGEGAN